MKSNIKHLYILFWLIVFSAPALAESESGTGSSAVTRLWSEAELEMLRQQSINRLPPLAADPTNKFSYNPLAVKLGHKLFFDKRLSSNVNVSCASCHQPEKSFTDGLPKSKGISETNRSAPTIIGIAYSAWFFWDGRSDSLWSQALGPLESGVEHGGNRSQFAQLIASDTNYRRLYEKIFGSLPDLSDKNQFKENAAPLGNRKSDNDWYAMSPADQKTITQIYVNIGKSIAAYERLLMPAPARFDKYVEAVLNNALEQANTILSADEIAGLKLFNGKAMCITCHQGPLFTHHGFHNTGVPDPASIRPKITLKYMAKKYKPILDEGRYKGILLALKSEFNCLGEFSDAKQEDCAELKFANKKRDETLGAFKVPTLRNIAQTAPYMHAGQFKNLAEVLQHYNTIPVAPVGHTDLLPIKLTQKELKQLESFLYTLSSPLANSELLQN